MKFLILSLLFVASAAGAVRAAEPPVASSPQAIVVKLGHFTDDLHAAFMAVKLAGLLQKQGARVTLFLNLEGVALADARQPSDLDWGHSKDLGKLFGEAVAEGVRVVVCPHCAKAKGLAEKHLRKGAVIGDDALVAKMFLSADKLLDY